MSIDKVPQEDISLFSQIIDSLVTSLETKKEFPPPLIEDIRKIKGTPSSEFPSKLDQIIGWEG